MTLLKYTTAAIALMAAVPASAATFMANDANGLVVATPAAGTTIGNNTPTSPDAVTGFFEASVVLAADLALNIGGTLMSGTAVDSHMFFFNREGTSNAGPIDAITASFTFSGEILGFITGTGKLGNTDTALGATGVNYDQFNARGFEGNDAILAYDQHTFSVFLEITQPGDWFRVLTTPGSEINEVPLPAGAPLLLAGLGGLAFLRRRRKA